MTVNVVFEIPDNFREFYMNETGKDPGIAGNDMDFRKAYHDFVRWYLADGSKLAYEYFFKQVLLKESEV